MRATSQEDELLRGMDYNLGNKKNCLVGNWSEELSLKEYAGHYRMPHDGAKGTSTYKRCVEHSLRYDTKDLATTNRKDFNEPTAPNQNLQYKSSALVGAREQLMMKKMQAGEKRRIMGSVVDSGNAAEEDDQKANEAVIDELGELVGDVPTKKTTPPSAASQAEVFDDLDGARGLS